MAREQKPNPLLSRMRRDIAEHVRVRVGRDPATGKTRYHFKSIYGSAEEARAYVNWYAGLVAAGEASETVSQSELQDLAELERRAAGFREKLLARVEAGGRVEPGPLSLACVLP
jgi:hypothetical protein